MGFGRRGQVISMASPYFTLPPDFILAFAFFASLAMTLAPPRAGVDLADARGGKALVSADAITKCSVERLSAKTNPQDVYGRGRGTVQ